MTIVYQYRGGIKYLQLVYSWDEITTTGISKWCLVYSRDEISFWDDWWYAVVMKYIFEMTGGIQSWWQGIGRLSQQPATVCVCGPFGTSMQHHHQHHYHINNNDNHDCYGLQFFCFCSFHHLHHSLPPSQTLCFRIPALIHPWTTPLDIGEVSQNRKKKSSKKMSHLHSRKYIFIKETCHFHPRKDKIFIQGEKRPKSYINLDFRVNSTACLPIRNSKVNIIRFWIWGVRIPRSILFLLSF